MPVGCIHVRLNCARMDAEPNLLTLHPSGSSSLFPSHIPYVHVMWSIINALVFAVSVRRERMMCGKPNFVLSVDQYTRWTICGGSVRWLPRSNCNQWPAVQGTSSFQRWAPYAAVIKASSFCFIVYRHDDSWWATGPGSHSSIPCGPLMVVMDLYDLLMSHTNRDKCESVALRGVTFVMCDLWKGWNVSVHTFSSYNKAHSTELTVVVSKWLMHKEHNFKFQYFVVNRRMDRWMEGECCQFTRLEQGELNDQVLS